MRTFTKSVFAAIVLVLGLSALLAAADAANLTWPANLPVYDHVVIVPNLINDMHNAKPQDSVPAGDKWLRHNIDPYYQWAKSNNSLLIVTFDENDDERHLQGLTDPFTTLPDGRKKLDMQNRIVTVFAGAHVKHSDYPEGKGITHVNVLRTLEAMYGCHKSGAQQMHAAHGGITDDFIITDVFQPPGK